MQERAEKCTAQFRLGCLVNQLDMHFTHNLLKENTNWTSLNLKKQKGQGN